MNQKKMKKMNGKKTRLIDANALMNRIDHDTAFSALLEELLDEQPTIEAQPHWIPCSEQLPENMERVNITWVNRDPVPYYMNIKDKPFTATGIYFKGKWYWDSVTCEDTLGEYGENEIDEVDGCIEIVAWMPMPKPYEVTE